MTALERAFDLASSGKCLSVMDILLSLRAEGYSVDQLQGPALRHQLKELIEKALKPMPKGSKGAKRPKIGKAGGAAKAKSTDSPRRKEIAKLASKARWEG